MAIEGYVFAALCGIALYGWYISHREWRECLKAVTALADANDLPDAERVRKLRIMWGTIGKSDGEVQCG